MVINGNPSPTGAVIIPLHNGIKYTKRCIAALRKQDAEEFEIIVVDDGSTDGTGEWIEAEYPEIVLMPGTGDLWWSGAVNLGCRTAIARGASTIVLLNNDDAELSAFCIRILSELAAKRVACVSAVVLQEAADGMRTILSSGGLLDWRGGGLTLCEAGSSYRLEAKVVERDWLPGIALAFTSEIFLALKGFDARHYPQYWGDSDFTIRARQHGYPCLVSYECWVLNDRTQSGFHFRKRVTYREILKGLTTRKSPYKIPDVCRFAIRYCPRKDIPRFIILYYIRYFYACAKTRWPGVIRVRNWLLGPKGTENS